MNNSTPLLLFEKECTRDNNGRKGHKICGLPYKKKNPYYFTTTGQNWKGSSLTGTFW